MPRDRDDANDLKAIVWRDVRWTRRKGIGYQPSRAAEDRHILIALLRAHGIVADPAKRK